MPALVGLVVQILSAERIGEDANRAITVMYVEERVGGRGGGGEREERGVLFQRSP